MGRGSVIGDAIVKHPLVRKISFTGGTTTGRHLAHLAAEKLITTSLELGGKSPTIVLQMQILNWLLRGWLTVFLVRQTGVYCRFTVIVHRSIYDQFLNRLIEITKALRVGHPETAGVHLGSLINPKHLASVDAYVQLAKQEGGQVVVGGQALTDGELAKGSYYLPTIITGLDNAAQTCQEEILVQC